MSFRLGLPIAAVMMALALPALAQQAIQQQVEPPLPYPNPTNAIEMQINNLELTKRQDQANLTQLRQFVAQGPEIMRQAPMRIEALEGEIRGNDERMATLRAQMPKQVAQTAPTPPHAEVPHTMTNLPGNIHPETPAEAAARGANRGRNVPSSVNSPVPQPSVPHPVQATQPHPVAPMSTPAK